jgi:hypothetical protein
VTRVYRQRLRALVVEELRQKHELYSEFVEGDSKAYSGYVHKMSLESVWGDAVTLVAIANCLDLNVSPPPLCHVGTTWPTIFTPLLDVNHSYAYTLLSASWRLWVQFSQFVTPPLVFSFILFVFPILQSRSLIAITIK